MLRRLPRMEGHGAGPSIKTGPALAGHGGEAVRDAIARAIISLPEQLRRSARLGPGSGDEPTRPAADRHEPVGLLLRPARPLAAGHERDRQRAAAALRPEGRRPDTNSPKN